jgi:GDP-4-dehydro-6-deoxy-D-mannose reductase
VKHVLITGIEGFVGQHLAQHLSSQNYKISGIYFQEPPKRIGELYQCDIRNRQELLNIIKMVMPDAIFHLAAQSSVLQAEKNLSETFAINTHGTLNLLDVIREIGINTRLIYISSSEVYGTTANTTHKLTEQSEVNPVSFYALSKYCAEKLCLYYIEHFNFDIIILRPFSHTGPGQSENFVFPRIAKQIAQIEAGKIERNITVGNLDVRRDYTDINDILKAYRLALEKCKKGEIYNITSSKSYSIRFGIEYLLSLSKKKIEVSVNEGLVRSNDIPLLTGSAEKFIQETGWKPQIDFMTTLGELLTYYRNKIQ